DVAQLGHSGALSLDGPVQEERLAADRRHDDRPAALHHAPDDPFADPVSRQPSLDTDSHRRVDGDFVAVVAQHHHRAAHRFVVALQLLQDALERVAQLGRARKDVADVLQRGQPAQVRPRLARPFRHAHQRRRPTFGLASGPTKMWAGPSFLTNSSDPPTALDHSWIWMPSWYEMVLGAVGGSRCCTANAMRVLCPSMM